MKALMLRTLLATLMLIQSVSTLAMMPSAAADTDKSVEAATPAALLLTMELSQPEPQPSCHGQRAATEPEPCCETMDEATCVLGCSLIVTAVTSLPALDNIDVHIPHPPASLQTLAHQPLSGLYRPPRIS